MTAAERISNQFLKEYHFQRLCKINGFSWSERLTHQQLVQVRKTARRIADLDLTQIAEWQKELFKKLGLKYEK